ncbi:MAG: hypothetical protein ACI82H_001292, partial [Alphaproteobacteria bacterium]
MLKPVKSPEFWEALIAVPTAKTAPQEAANIPLYRIKTHHDTFRAKLRQQFTGRIKQVHLRVGGKNIDFTCVRAIRKYTSVTCVSLENASLQVKHRKIRGEITFYVEGI